VTHTSANPILRAATAADHELIHDLLVRNGLPTGDLAASRPQFIVACDGERVIGTGAIQPYGSAALLRSVAIEAQSRGTGVGRLIVAELERRARAAGIGKIVLLTLTAADFFARLGYSPQDRIQVPAPVLDSAEFRSLCPASAICMEKHLL
jgi:amino-acid N-acetyltransferase